MQRKQASGGAFWSTRQTKRLRTTLGLFSIGLIVPLMFLFPRIYLQVKTQAFNENYLRVKSVTRRLTREIDHLERNQPGLLTTAEIEGTLKGLIRKKFYESRFSQSGSLQVTHNGLSLLTLEEQPLFFLTRLGWGYTSSPLEDYGNQDFPFFFESRIGGPSIGKLDLVYASRRIPFEYPAVLALLDCTTVLLAMVFGFWAAHRLGCQYIQLAEKERRFVATVSHELKTPLSTIALYSEMLSDERHRSPEKLRRYGKYIQTEIHRLDQLINDVLSVSSPDNVGMMLEPEEVRISSLLQEVREATEPLTRSAGFVLETSSPKDAESEEIALQVNRLAFTRIIVNLVENAVKFSKNAADKIIDIGYRISSEFDEVEFYVRDYGDGIAVADREKIFELFQRGNQVDDVPGTGIGLTVARELARAMGGQLDLAVATTQGAEFSIRFQVS